MTYSIFKTINGNTGELHKGISTYENAFDILQSMADHYKRGKHKVKIYKWQLNINDNDIVYQIK